MSDAARAAPPPTGRYHGVVALSWASVVPSALLLAGEDHA
jgi:hypothetical protein